MIELGEALKIVKNNKELIYNFAREENDYKHFFLPSMKEVINKNNPNATGYSKRLIQEDRKFFYNKKIIY
jgi:hypothetical protein